MARPKHGTKNLRGSGRPEASSFRRPTTLESPLEAERNPCPEIGPASSSPMVARTVVVSEPECTYWSPATISIAPLKFPMFQLLSATRRTHDSTALRVSCVGCDMMSCVTHALTCTNEHDIYRWYGTRFYWLIAKRDVKETYLVETFDERRNGRPVAGQGIGGRAAKVQGHLAQVLDGRHLVEQLVLAVGQPERDFFREMQQLLEFLQLAAVGCLRRERNPLLQLWKGES